MESLYILIPIAIVFLAVAIKAFLWAADNKQFDDLDQEASRILFEDPVTPKNLADSSTPTTTNKNSNTDSKDDSTA